MTQKTKTTWRTVMLGDVADVFGGGTPSTTQSQYWKGEIPWLTPAEVVANGTRFVSKTQRAISEEGLKNSSTKLMPAGSVLLTSRATIGEVVINETPMATNQGFINISPKAVDRMFLFYWLRRNKRLLKQHAIGSTFPEISKSVFKKLSIQLPDDIEEQKRIAGVLAAFDEKIENNNRIIRTLEEMAQAIFKKQFNVPVDDLPKGWEVKNVLEIVKRISVGKKYENKTALSAGKMPILDQGQSGYIGFHNDEPGVEASIDEPVAVFTNHTCNYRLMTRPFSAIQNVLPYVGINDYPTLFVYYLTRGKITMQEYKGHWPEFELQEFVVPPPSLAKEFASFVKPMVQKIVEAENENQKLAAMRDLLLPRLMSGEIRV